LLWVFRDNYGPRLGAVLLCLFWSTGVLTCLERSLADVLAVLLSLALLYLGSSCSKTVLFAGALLAKETSLLSIPALWKSLETPPSKKLLYSGLAIAPLLAWVLYVGTRFSAVETGPGSNLFIPFVEFARKLTESYQLASETGWQRVRVFEVLAPLSLAIQAVYLIVFPWRKAVLKYREWWYGIGFALLLFALGRWVWTEQFAYTRSMLPLTVAFNLLILRAEKTHLAFWTLLIIGNTGLLWRAIEWFAMMRHVY
jgi:hypothetical protein